MTLYLRDNADWRVAPFAQCTERAARAVQRDVRRSGSCQRPVVSKAQLSNFPVAASRIARGCRRHEHRAVRAPAPSQWRQRSSPSRLDASRRCPVSIPRNTPVRSHSLSRTNDAHSLYSSRGHKKTPREGRFSLGRGTLGGCACLAHLRAQFFARRVEVDGERT